MHSKNARLAPLPPHLTPATSSLVLVSRYITRRLQQGYTRDDLARALGVTPPYISALKNDRVTRLPWQQVDRFAQAMGLTEEETVELRTTVLLELHGQMAVLCVPTMLSVLYPLHVRLLLGDGLAAVVEDLEEEAKVHPFVDFFDESLRAKLRQVTYEHIQQELRKMADE